MHSGCYVENKWLLLCLTTTVANKLKTTNYTNRPQLCRDYNCIAWANYSNQKDKSETLARAIEVHKELMAEKEREQ